MNAVSLSLSHVSEILSPSNESGPILGMGETSSSEQFEKKKKQKTTSYCLKVTYTLRGNKNKKWIFKRKNKCSVG